MMKKKVLLILEKDIVNSSKVALIMDLINKVADQAWEESRYAFAKENGEDVTDIEEDGVIATDVEDFIKLYLS